MRHSISATLLFFAPVLLAVDEPILLPKFVVYADAEDERNVETNAIYGFPIDWIEAPRSVTSFSSAALDSGAVTSVRDFSKLYSSGYSKTNFGSPAHPSIRGLPADILVDGIRQGLRSFGNGMPFSFNAYDKIDVVKGIPNPAFGIQQYVSGYINLERKLPDFVPMTGSISSQYGSYDTKFFTFEFQDKLADNFSYLFSTEIENSGSYYNHGFKDSQAYYFAVAYEPSERYRSDLSFDYLRANYTENFGLNRPTQSLIDSGEYQTGTITDTNGDGVRDNRDINGAFNEIELGSTEEIDRRKRLLASGDQAEGQHLNVHLRQRFDATENWTLENTTMYRWVDRELLSSYYYSELINDSYAIENRFTSQFRYASPFQSDREAHLLTGLTLRYQHVRAINDYFNEPANAWDLASNQAINYVNQVANGSIPIAGRPGFFGTPGQFNGETNDSEALTVAPFIHWRVPVTGRTTFDIGSRLDILDVEFEDPLGSFRDSHTAYLPSFTASLSHSIFDDLHAYASYAYGQSSAIANGGGYAISPDGFTDDYFERDNYLFELGLKGRIGDRGTVPWLHSIR